MDASTRPNEPACPFADGRPNPYASTRAFIVSPSGDCVPGGDVAKAERIKAIAEQVKARQAELEAAENRLRSKVALVQLCDIRPCPENDTLYGSQSLDDPDVLSLIASIKEHGVTDPIRIGLDNVIISGHRRRFCAIQAGLREVPAIRERVSYSASHDDFMRLVVEANEQRKKSPEMLMREAAMKIDPAKAVADLKAQQQERKAERLYGNIGDQKMETSTIASRKKISEGSMPFLEAARKVAEAHREFWPLSVRQIHYRLLNDPPLKFTKKDKVRYNRKGEVASVKPAVQDESRRYANDEESYKALVNLLARARVAGLFPWDAVEDETRPEDTNNDYWNVGEFTQAKVERFLSGYQRNRMQSQPAHIEIVAEKLTVRSILADIADDHSIPLTISRGHCGPTLKRRIAQRFRRSKKDTLIVLVVSDMDPAGQAIVQNMHDDLIDDFGIPEDRLEVYRAGMTMPRVEELDLSPSYDTEEKDVSTKQAYLDLYDTTDCYELEAMEPEDLRDALIEDIDEVLDIDAYNAELAMEEKEAVQIAAMKSAVTEFMRGWTPTTGA
jgi:site-specific DNA-cytosine methylase